MKKLNICILCFLVLAIAISCQGGSSSSPKSSAPNNESIDASKKSKKSTAKEEEEEDNEPEQESSSVSPSSIKKSSEKPTTQTPKEEDLKKDAPTSSNEMGTTTIEFESKFHDFGVKKEGEQLWHTYVFKNTGQNKLKLEMVKSSCNCTHPYWNKGKEFAPGDTGHINIRFDSKDKQGLQKKSVHVIANTKPKMTEIRFNTEIEKK